jgi:hypothetical protein
LKCWGRRGGVLGSEIMCMEPDSNRTKRTTLQKVPAAVAPAIPNHHQARGSSLQG